MHDAPSPLQIVDAVAGYLRDAALPALSAGTAHQTAAYQARVSANLLDIARRQLAEDPAVSAGEAARLRALLGGAAGDLAALNRALCERIVAGEFTLATPGLTDHLWRVTLAKLAVDQPAYSTYRRLAGAGLHEETSGWTSTCPTN